MGHLERHTAICDADMIARLLEEWKCAVSHLYETPVMDRSMKEGENIIRYDHMIGYGYNRFFERIESDTMMVVIKDGHIHTAYAIIDGRSDLKYPFADFNIKKYAGKNYHEGLWKLFVMYENAGYSVRYLWNRKNPQLRIYDQKGKVYKIGKNMAGIQDLPAISEIYTQDSFLRIFFGIIVITRKKCLRVNNL